MKFKKSEIMKKSVTLLMMTAIVAVMYGQNCQPSFTYQSNFLTGEVTFNGYVNSNDSAIHPVDYAWSFGDGASGTGQLVTHTYNPAGGYYLVCLTINTANGCTGTYCDSVGFSQNSNCFANFSYLIDSVTQNSETYSFYGGGTPDNGETITQYNWTISNGYTHTGQNFQWTFTTSGYYTICLYITTSSGCTNHYCQTIYVSAGNTTGCNAYFTYSIDSASVYQFTDQSNGDSVIITSWQWSFGDGTGSQIQNPTHIFNGNGLYHVCLTISTSNGCSSTFCDSIIVGNGGCQLSGTLYPHGPTTIGGSDGFIISNIYGGTPPYTYQWSTGATTADIHNLPSGVYTLHVVDVQGCQINMTAGLYEPYDTTGGNIVDTLTTGIIDTCLNFVPDSFYISNVVVDPNSNTVTVTWNFTGGGMTGTIEVTYTFTYYGNTAIIITINCGNKALTSFMSYINIYSASTVQNTDNSREISVYPVPFSEKIMIDLLQQEKTTFTISDITGRTLISVIRTSAGGPVEINTSALPSGAYILNIESSNGNIFRHIVKQ